MSALPHAIAFAAAKISWPCLLSITSGNLSFSAHFAE